MVQKGVVCAKEIRDRDREYRKIESDEQKTRDASKKPT
jgi:hypothetical protein